MTPPLEEDLSNRLRCILSVPKGHEASMYCCRGLLRCNSHLFGKFQADGHSVSGAGASIPRARATLSGYTSREVGGQWHKIPS